MDLQIVIPMIEIEHVLFITNKTYEFNIITNRTLDLFHMQISSYVVMNEIETSRNHSLNAFRLLSILWGLNAPRRLNSL